MGLWPGGGQELSPQIKDEAVQLMIESGSPVAEVVCDLEINEGTLGNWVGIGKLDNPEPETALTPVECACVAEMVAKTRKLRTENEFLKGSDLLRQDASVGEWCALIEAEKAHYLVGWMCA